MELKLAGLGRKKHTFCNTNGGHQYVQAELESIFPKLAPLDGKFHLYKGRSGGDRTLVKIKMGSEGKKKAFKIMCRLEMYYSSIIHLCVYPSAFIFIYPFLGLKIIRS